MNAVRNFIDENMSASYAFGYDDGFDFASGALSGPAHPNNKAYMRGWSRGIRHYQMDMA